MTYIEERLLKSGLVEERSLSKGTSTSPDLSVPWCTALVMLLKRQKLKAEKKELEEELSFENLEGGPQSRDLYLELFMVQKDILALTKKGEASKKGDGGRS
ncbi:hypothetical protein WN944_023954 [Citrus x changshan-huyou]|uniref:Uncharacterized protein n=1 Tax=Citrus x changshan-huyou TaxID=2935761 RepID=A0AAP0LM33_9ROSI